MILYGIAKTCAPSKDERGRAHWDNEGDEVRFLRFLNFSGRCATARAAFESPRYAAIAVANQGEKIPDIYKQDPHQVLEDIVKRWIEADEAERAEKALDETPAAEPTKDQVEYAREIAEEERKTWNPDDGIDGELA